MTHNLPRNLLPSQREIMCKGHGELLIRKPLLSDSGQKWENTKKKSKKMGKNKRPRLCLAQNEYPSSLVRRPHRHRNRRQQTEMALMLKLSALCHYN